MASTVPGSVAKKIDASNATNRSSRSASSSKIVSLPAELTPRVIPSIMSSIRVTRVMVPPCASAVLPRKRGVPGPPSLPGRGVPQPVSPRHRRRHPLRVIEGVEMKVGIGLPAAVPDVDTATLLPWARQAEAQGFDALGVIDRVVYPNHEPLMALAAAAAVTEGIELVTDVLIGPVRTTTLLAKQAATLDRLAGGRLTLGLGLG